jgi:hypothetical protein
VRNRFRYTLVLASGRPADPADFESGESDWDAGDVFLAPGERWFRILRVEPHADVAGVDREAVWTVERIP